MQVEVSIKLHRLILVYAYQTPTTTVGAPRIKLYYEQI